MKHVEVVAAIIRKGNKYFATQCGYGEWEFLGGKMEAWETLEKALKWGNREELEQQKRVRR